MERPSEDELAAIVAAYLTLVRRRAPAAPAAVPRWRRAARLEAVLGEDPAAELRLSRDSGASRLRSG